MARRARKTHPTDVRDGFYGGANSRCESAEVDIREDSLDLSRRNRGDQPLDRNSVGCLLVLLIHSGRKGCPRRTNLSSTGVGYRYESLFAGGVEWICCRINKTKGGKRYQAKLNCIGR